MRVASVRTSNDTARAGASGEHTAQGASFMDDLLEAASKPKTARPAAGRRFVTKLHTSLESAESVWRRLERDGVSTAFQRLDRKSTRLNSSLT